MNINYITYITIQLQRSSRPVLFLGYGAKDSDYETLKNILGIPVLLTWKSMDFLGEDDPHFCGRPGMISTRGANFVLQNTDLLLCIGTRLDPVSIAYNYMNFAYNAQKIVVDIDQAELDKLPNSWIKINQDAKEFIDNLIANLKTASWLYTWTWENWIVNARELYLKYRSTSVLKSESISTYQFIEHLSNILNKDDIIVSGSSGVNIEIFYQSFKVKKGQRIFGLPGFGAMGTGLPLAIGVACAIRDAHLDNRVILLDGDGSFQVNIQELETVRRLGLPLKIFVLSNGGYGSIHNMQEKRFGRFVGCDEKSGLTLPCLDCVAEVWGGEGSRVSPWCIWQKSQIEEYLKSILSDNEQVLCEVVVPINQKVEPFVNSTLQKDGSYQIDDIDNMSPYLPKEERIRNLIVPIMEKCPNFMGASVPLKKAKLIKGSDN
jgi:acetolactate synthase-1/2/3 large subunit